MQDDSVMDVDSEVLYAGEESVNILIQVLSNVVKTTTSLDLRYIWSSLRELSSIRKDTLDQQTLAALVGILYPESSMFKNSLLKYINDNQKIDVTDAEKIRNSYPSVFYEVTNKKTIEVAAEVNAFVHLLVQLYLLDSGKLQELDAFNKKIVIPNVLYHYNKRTLNLINAKLWFYVVICNEKLGRKTDLIIRSEMIKFLRIASLKHDHETKAMLINLILRDCLSAGDIEAAADFVAKVDFPITDVSSSLEARYYFYLSKIYAIQLNYSTANEYIISAIRKAPNTNNSLGFLQQAYKLQCVIELLMGDIPELSFFTQSNIKKSLEPYYYISNAVKHGNLQKFTSAIKTYKQQLIKDGNYQICVRLRSNVIKTGIRIISLTYKKISLKDICLRLHLDSEQTVEYMVSRAIRDGVIEAKINNEEGTIETSELLNTYGTTQPQQMFDERINFVNQLHDECVKAMRYPDKKKDMIGKKENQDGFLDKDIFDDSSDFSDIEDFGFL
ncbi:hypothetical protein TPHA_0E00330 [Tetrapisispora phaffii CBS 4417]|uniref:PCI domain-containing protein n=1 Tax=Tetrapisispora phaffii (strain ATCC 24235 / CBS 4417 / NBRC 1672 / NRRL Y-8282 / UCD 70-5) TaxID=1071381 RepID=G8BTA1_TETPH|nr:hypothetical protein TPHA_0E00330 [Tetrapisispora phaffii CBS 4417]CCE63129.1 hypothetical protein TPHA_0E00330 [Tetrapisispora phaffii CBS 4417]